MNLSLYIIAEEKNQEFRIGGEIRNQVIFWMQKM